MHVAYTVLLQKRKKLSQVNAVVLPRCRAQLPGQHPLCRIDFQCSCEWYCLLCFHASCTAHRIPPAELAPVELPPSPAPELSPIEQECIRTPGCVARVAGTNESVWADSARSGTCQNHDDEDWLVTYTTNSEAWSNVSPSDIRFYGGVLAVLPVLTFPKYARAGIHEITPPGQLPFSLTLCLARGELPHTGNITISGPPKPVVMNTWIWLRPR